MKMKINKEKEGEEVGEKNIFIAFCIISRNWKVMICRCMLITSINKNQHITFKIHVTKGNTDLGLLNIFSNFYSQQVQVKPLEKCNEIR